MGACCVAVRGGPRARAVQAGRVGRCALRRVAARRRRGGRARARADHSGVRARRRRPRPPSRGCAPSPSWCGPAGSRADIFHDDALDPGAGVLAHPCVGRGEVPGGRGEHERRPRNSEEQLEVLAARPVRASSKVDPGRGEDVEHDERGRPDGAAAGSVHRGWVDAALECSEVEPAARRGDHELTVEHRAGRHLLDEAGEHLGEVPGQRALLSRLQEAAFRGPESQAALSYLNLTARLHYAWSDRSGTSAAVAQSSSSLHRRRDR